MKEEEILKSQLRGERKEDKEGKKDKREQLKIRLRNAVDGTWNIRNLKQNEKYDFLKDIAKEGLVDTGGFGILQDWKFEGKSIGVGSINSWLRYTLSKLFGTK